jgi:type VI secretion system ImpM family protein
MGLALGFCGKLPEYPDFIKSDSLSGSLLEFNTWFNAAFDHLTRQLGEDFKDAYSELPRLGMIVKLPESKRPVVCLSSPSHDLSGRNSPFNLFAEVPSPMYREQLSLIPEAYWLFFQIADKCLNNSKMHFEFGRQQNTMWALGEGLPGSTTESQMRCSSFLKSMTLSAFSESLGHVADTETGTIRKAFIALALTRETYSDSLQAVFRFPLSGKTDHHPLEMAFWILFTEAVLGVHLDNQALLWRDSRVDIAFGSVNERALTLSWIPNREDDNIWDFVAMNLDGSMISEQLFDRFNEIMANEDIRLGKFLDSIHRLFETK